MLVVAQVVDGLADVPQLDSGVEQVLHHLQLEQVLEGVQALGARPAGVAHRGTDQAGSGPVVQLPVADADDPAHLRDPVSLLLDHHSSVITSG